MSTTLERQAPEDGDGLASYVQGLGVCFDRAARREGIRSHDLEIAGQPLRLLFASEALAAQVLPAFAHLPTPSEASQPLVVRIWDSRTESGATPELPALPTQTALPPGAFVHRSDGAVHLAVQPRRRLLSAIDTEVREAWFWSETGELPYWERSAPLRHIVHWWLSEFGVQMVHSAAVGSEHGAVLVVGRSGSGKSTTALTSLGAGLSYLGDDYVLVSRDPEPRVHSAFCSGKLTAEHVHRFPRLAASVTNPDALAEEKALVYVHGMAGASTVRSARLRAVLVPKVVNRPDTRVVNTTRAAALAALAPSTVVEVFTAGRQALQRMAALLADLPCYSLEAGYELDQVGLEVRRLLERMGTEDP